MFSVAVVRSALGVANYFAKDDFKDNYYMVDGFFEVSAWGGVGAEVFALEGEVSRESFE